MDYLILVNKFSPAPDGFADALQLCEVGGRLFERQAGAELEKMLRSALADGLKISVISGLRSADYQQLLWEKEISLEMSRGLSYAEAVSKVGRTLALPGCSEHCTGLAADLGTENADDCEPDFHRSPQGRWLCENAADYGFILRYPRHKEHFTGIDYEPWHYRYVGREAAKIIKSSGICLEEFLHFYDDSYTLSCGLKANFTNRSAFSDP